jgi:uncharacterized protein involved in propanediol utilization
MMRAAAHQVSGHFGELMQGRLGRDGPIALISLPCAALNVTAWRRPGRHLALHGARLLSPQRARLFLRSLGLSLRAPVQIRANIMAGSGAGSSTAALVALARVAGWQGDPAELARACVVSEGATDPLMFAQAERLLWASRQAVVLDQLPALPKFEIVGGFYGPGQRTDAKDQNFPDISDLLQDWRRAADLETLAQLASISASRTLALRHAWDDPTPELARATGALGYVIAHTGSARGLLFAPQTVPEVAQAALRAAGFRGVLRFTAGGGKS